MLNRFRIQIKNLGIYLLASLIPMLASLVSNPFVAKNMSPEDYGIVGYYSAFSTLFLPLVNFYLLHYYTKRYFEVSKEQRLRLKATIFKALIIFSVLMSVFALLLLFFYTIIFNEGSEVPFYPYALIAMLTLPISGIYTLSLVDMRMSRDSIGFFKLSVSNGLLVVLITLLFVVIFKWGAFGKMIATTVSSVLIFTYIFWKNRNLLVFEFDSDDFKVDIRFCWPLVLASMLTFFSSGYDKVYLERLGDINSLGIYAVGSSIAGYLNVFATSINDTFQPDIFKNIVKRDYKKTFGYVLLKICIMSIAVVAFIILAPYIIRLLTFGRYEDATPYAQIISLSCLTSMLYYSMSQVTIALGFTSITLINKVIGSVLSILCFNFLISKYSALGAAWGVVLSYVLFFLGNVLLVLVKSKTNENRNTNISQTV